MPSRRGAFWPLTRVRDDCDSIMCLKVRLTRRVWLAKLFAFSPEQGAETIVYLASSPAVAETTGNISTSAKQSHRRQRHKTTELRMPGRSSSAASASNWFHGARPCGRRWAGRASWHRRLNEQVGTKVRHLRKHKSLAAFAEGDAFRRLVQRSLEALDRLAKTFDAETKSEMMDRYDEMSAGFIGHLHGLFRCAVRMNPGIVSANKRPEPATRNTPRVLSPSGL